MLGLEPAADRQASSGIKELPTHVQGRGAPAATGGRVTGHTGIGSCGVLALNGRPVLRHSGRPAGHVERERHGWDGAERADPPFPTLEVIPVCVHGESCAQRSAWHRAALSGLATWCWCGRAQGGTVCAVRLGPAGYQVCRFRGAHIQSRPDSLSQCQEPAWPPSGHWHLAGAKEGSAYAATQPSGSCTLPPLL